MPGTQLGPYRIEARIGAGGMGEVYRARDTRLSRTVAIKIVPPDLAAQPEFRRRFEQEAQAIASLNHPHICTLFDVGDQDGVSFMVMEHLEGETLAARLQKGPLPFAEVLQHGVEIANALYEAHRRGIVHRDIKPGNVMLTRSGVKLLDFGLARWRKPSASSSDSPTISMTGAGQVVGTPQYMAPEQVEGKELDSRADIFAFGCVLWEMISGHPAFQGESSAAVMASILRDTPLTEIEDLPPAFNHTLRMCLTKNRDERWQSSGDLLRELIWIQQSPESRPLRSAKVGRREWIAWGGCAVLAGTAVAALMSSFRSRSPKAMRMQFQIREPDGLSLNLFQTPPVVSPDGSMLIVCALSAATGRLSLWLRNLSSLEFRELPGTEGGGSVFWSPDSRSIGFFAGDQLKLLRLGTETPQPICESPFGLGGTWNEDGVIVFQRGIHAGLFQVTTSGGTPRELTTLKPGETGHIAPCFLPGGKHVVFTVVGTKTEVEGVFLTSLQQGERRRLLGAASNARYVPAGLMVFRQNEQLVAQRFNTDALRLEGDARVVADAVWTFGPAASFSTSNSGVLVFAERESVRAQLAWYDRSGRMISHAGQPGPYIQMDLSKDERRVLLERYEGQRGELWVLDLDRNVQQRLPTPKNGWAWQGYWSPDGTSMVYTWSSVGSQSIYRRDANGTTQGEQLLPSAAEGPWSCTDWSPDGGHVVFTAFNPSSLMDLWVLPMSGERTAFPYIQGPANDAQGRISPDGKWMAYTSNESGPNEIYVASFPRPMAKWRISTNGGSQPHWREDGKELFYLAADSKLMAVTVRTSPGFQAGTPSVLFPVRLVAYFGGGRKDYAASRDGQRFLVNTRMTEGAPQNLTVITGW